MLGRTRQWFWRNRTRFAVGAGTIGGLYLAGQYAWSKWLEAQQRMGEERIAKENLRRRFEQNQEDCTYTVLALLPTIREELIGTFPVEQITNELQKQKAERLQRSVGGLSEVASTDLPSGSPSMIDDGGSTGSLQTGSFIHASQMAESSNGSGGQLRPRKSKVQLWYEMKIQSITRALTLLYTLSLLTLLTRIQLNLLGRRTYLSSVVSLASPPRGQEASTISLENNDDDNYDNVYGSDFETNRQYLTFSWWLLHRGCNEIARKVGQSVQYVFGSMNPREDITLDRLSELILEVRKRVEGSTEAERQEQRWLPYLLPPREEEESVLRQPGISPNDSSPSDGNDRADPLDTPQIGQQKTIEFGPSLRRLLDETSDLIDSPTFTHVLTQLLNSCFSHLIDVRIASEAYKIPPPTPESILDPTNRIQEVSDKKVKLAQTLAIFCRQAHFIAAGSADVDELGATEGPPNEYLAAIDGVKDLEAFAAVIYSSNFEFEAIEEAQRQESQARARESAGESIAENAGLEPQVARSDPPTQEAIERDKVDDAAGSGLFESAWIKAAEKGEPLQPAVPV